MIIEHNITEKEKLLDLIVLKIKEWAQKRGDPALLMFASFRQVFDEVNEKVPGKKRNVPRSEYNPLGE